jgi:hypothetical protein
MSTLKKIPCHLCRVLITKESSLHCPLCHRNMCIECSSNIDMHYKILNKRHWASTLEKDIYRTTLEDIITAGLEEERGNFLGDTPRESIESLYAKESFPMIYGHSICDKCLEDKLLTTLKEYPMETAGLLINANPPLQIVAKRRLQGE